MGTSKDTEQMVKRTLEEEAELHSVTINSQYPGTMLDIQLASTRIHRLWEDLWIPNVIHGEKWLRQAKNSNVMMADISDIVLALWKLEVLSPIKFRPSLSRAAFLGLHKGVTHADHAKEPNATNAADWDWRVVKDCTGVS